MAIPDQVWKSVNEITERYRVGNYRGHIRTTRPLMIVGCTYDPDLDKNRPCVHVTLLGQPGLIREVATALEAAGHRVHITHWNAGLSFVPMSGPATPIN